MSRDFLILATVFAACTGVAALAGAVNLGTALAFGQIGFAATLVGLMLRIPRSR